MATKRMGLRTFCVVIALVFGLWAQGARANLASDVNDALSLSTLAEQVAAITALATANAGNLALFTQLVSLVSNGIDEANAGAFAAALASVCTGGAGDAGATIVIVSSLVTTFPGSGGDVTAEVIAAGCPPQVAASTLQATILAAAGQSLSTIQVVPNPNPGIGANDLQDAFVKSILTTRLGSNNDPTQSPS